MLENLFQTFKGQSVYYVRPHYWMIMIVINSKYLSQSWSEIPREASVMLHFERSAWIICPPFLFSLRVLAEITKPKYLLKYQSCIVCTLIQVLGSSDISFVPGHKMYRVLYDNNASISASLSIKYKKWAIDFQAWCIVLVEGSWGRTFLCVYILFIVIRYT